MRRLCLMAILVSTLAVIGLAVACQQPPPPSPPDTRAADERAIREADAAWSKAWAAKDLEGCMSFVADDASVLLANGPTVTGKESIRKWASEVMANPGFAGSWQASKVEASRAGDLAYVVGTGQITVNDPKGKPVTDRLKYLTVWKKQRDGTWKALVDTANSDLPAPGTAGSAGIRAAHDRWFAGILGDRARLSDVLAPDVTLRFPGGNQVTRTQFLTLLQTGQLLYDAAEHQETNIRIYGDAGVVTGRSMLRFRFQGKAESERLAYTAVYVRTSGRWTLVAWQSTIDQEG